LSKTVRFETPQKLVLAQDYEVAIAAELKCQQQADTTARTISLVNRYALHTRCAAWLVACHNIPDR